MQQIYELISRGSYKCGEGIVHCSYSKSNGQLSLFEIFRCSKKLPLMISMHLLQNCFHIFAPWCQAIVIWTIFILRGYTMQRCEPVVQCKKLHQGSACSIHNRSLILSIWIKYVEVMWSTCQTWTSSTHMVLSKTWHRPRHGQSLTGCTINAIFVQSIIVQWNMWGP